MKNQSGPSLPDVHAVRAYRNAGQDLLIATGIGGIVGNFAGGTIAGAMLNNPWFFGTPFLSAKAVGFPVYTLVPVLLTALKYSASPGAMNAMLAAAGVFMACTLPMFIFGMRKARRVKEQMLKSDIHGSAHWASHAEIVKAGLLPTEKQNPADQKHVCYVGGWIDPKTKRHIYLQHTGPEHIIVHAPTRSGKGVGLVIPTLLSWRGSVLVHDIKGENHALTAGWRASIGQRILRFSPTEPEKSCRFNPLDEIRIGTPREISDVQNIATMIVDPDGKGLSDHWAKTGYALLVGTILHVLYCREIKEKTLASVASLLTTPPSDDDDDEDQKGPNLSGIDEIFKQMIEYDHNPPENLRLITPDGRVTKTHKVIAESAQEMLNKAGNEKSGVISTAMSFLSLYRDPLVASTIRTSDFHVDDLMNQDRPVSLYLVVPPSDKDRLKPLIRLILNQVIRRLTEKMEFEGGRSVAKYKHRLLLMIDEFPSLGKLDVFEEALAFIAGYGLKAYLICQDTAQLYKAYTQNESITSNAHVRVYYAPNRIETAKHISDQLGKFTVTTESHSVSYAGGQLMSYQTGTSGAIQHQARDLMTPDEVLRLAGPEKDAAGNIKRPGDMIVVSAGHAPVRGTQILYFLDPVFSRRSKILAPIVGDYIKGQDPKPPTPAAKPVEVTPQPPAPEKPPAKIVAPEPPKSIEPDPQIEIIDQTDIVDTIDGDLDDGLPPDFDADLPPAPEDQPEPDAGEIDAAALLDEAANEAARRLAEAVELSQETMPSSESARHKKADKSTIEGLF